MRALVIIAVSLVLAACQTTPPPAAKVEPQIVKVPTPVFCKPDLGPEPDYVTPDEFAMAPDVLVIVQLYKQDRGLRIKRDAEKDAALKKCAGP